ncbi:KUP/HAK/KT family potassium transporter [Flavitalea sp. BT771]|uniref:KUP/HAK/KT family potassium transporter n=1 Tax=Flavitalea sp. BT771 TaxID=3063329 RepID=UPI0026E2FD17|nr:KUP/HAK/KT family potassium transporter [Flavitalea sp. BT771]MDO6431297.1 KUP/HAK/KT family potassium transporter [Flavitalea sp. BT771]MDV6220205.1 KUP/HAK/KT family potassium transporter [Flavitalea sp. BT771]
MDTGHSKKITTAGLLITLGIIFGDIGTSPLYTFQTILNEGGKISSELVLGAISCVFWTLTLQTTFKYVLITLQADNRGEGGVFSLFALVRRYGKKLVYPAIIGAGTLLADGIITPPISVTSAIEGLNSVKGLEHIIVPGNNLVVELVLVILLLLFVFQRFGTKIVGGSFGPIMLIWFSMLAVLGINQIIHYPLVLKALSPHYGLELLIRHPKGFWLLGAVFLCTTGAEALYSDLGHCGRRNIQISWIFVKTALVLNYLGQGAWVLLQQKNDLGGVNPFFAIVPHWFLVPSVFIGMAASIIASQALISGSFTLINEAISLNFWPKVTVKFPTEIRGQIYIPSINWILCTGCFLVVLYFRTSESMTAAYGFSITIAMLMTTILVYHFLRYVKHYSVWTVIPILIVFVVVESSFFVANAVKIVKRLFFLVFEVGLIFTMYIWYHARKINNRFLNFIDLKEHIPLLESLSQDESIPRLTSHLIYLTKANRPGQIEQKILYSIFSHNPKRADIYWFLHIERTDEPYTMEYGVEELSDKVIRVEFRLGFRVQPRVGLMFRRVVSEMICNRELDITHRYPSLKKHNIADDFRYVILEKFLSYDNEFTVREGFILNAYFSMKKLALAEEKAFGLDSSETVVEKLPMLVAPATKVKLQRAYYRVHQSATV